MIVASRAFAAWMQQPDSSRRENAEVGASFLAWLWAVVEEVGFEPT